MRRRTPGVRHHYPQALPIALVAVADDVPGRADEAAAGTGSPASTLDWCELVADPGVQAVSITVPNFLHREVGAAFAAAASTSRSRIWSV